MSIGDDAVDQAIAQTSPVTFLAPGVRGSAPPQVGCPSGRDETQHLSGRNLRYQANPALPAADFR